MTMKLTEEMMNQIDQNNMKARAILQAALDAHQNNDTAEDYNLVVEAALDYLTKNYHLLDQAQ